MILTSISMWIRRRTLIAIFSYCDASQKQTPIAFLIVLRVELEWKNKKGLTNAEHHIRQESPSCIHFNWTRWFCWWNESRIERFTFFLFFSSSIYSLLFCWSVIGDACICQQSFLYEDMLDRQSKFQPRTDDLWRGTFVDFILWHNFSSPCASSNTILIDESTRAAQHLCHCIFACVMHLSSSQRLHRSIYYIWYIHILVPYPRSLCSIGTVWLCCCCLSLRL